MKIIFLELLKGLLLAACFLVFCLILATCSRSVYSNTVHPHGELALVSYNINGAYSPLRAFFMRKISMLLHLYGEAGEGHLRMCRSLVYLSTNPFQLCHPHLVVIGKASINTLGAH